VKHPLVRYWIAVLALGLVLGVVLWVGYLALALWP
jgi:hypothetical protein